MLDLIAGHLRQSDYDFRASANPDDPLAALFADWVLNGIDELSLGPCR